MNQSKTTYFIKLLRAGGLFICLPLLLLASIFYFILEGPIQNQLIAEHNRSVVHEIEIVDQELTRIAERAYTLSSMYMGDSRMVNANLKNDVALIDNATKEIKLFQGNNRYIKTSGIYISGPEPFLITGNGTFLGDQDQAFKNLTVGDEDPSSSWRVLNGEIYLVQEIVRYDDHQAVLQVALDKEAVLEALKGEIGTNLVGFSLENQFFTEADADEQLPKIFDEEKSGEKFDFEGSRYNLTKMKYSSLGSFWTFYTAVSLTNIFAALQWIKWFIVAMVIIAVTSTLFLTRFFKQTILRPVQKLFGNVFPAEADELAKDDQYFQQRLSEVLVGYQENLSRNDRNIKDIRSAFINRVVQRRYSYYSDEELNVKFLEVGFEPMRRDRLVSLQLTDAVGGTTKESPDDSINHFVISNILRDTASLYFKNYVILAARDNRVDLYLNALKSDVEVQGFVDEVQGALKRVTNHYSTVVISAPLSSTAQLVENYGKLSYFYDWQKIKVGNQVIYADRISAGRRVTNPASDVYTSQIIEGVKDGNLDLLESATRQYVATYTQLDLPFYALKNSVNTLRYQIERLLEEYGIDSAIINSEAQLERILSHTFDEEQLRAVLLNNVFEPAREAISLVRQQSMTKSFEQILNYIKDHYNDPLLSQELIAEIFDTDVFYVSKEFKKRTGSTYIDYITNLRLNKAKTLLSTTSDSIGSISEQVGYQASYFNRIFKKRIGVTPGEYRKGNR